MNLTLGGICSFVCANTNLRRGHICRKDTPSSRACTRERPFAITSATSVVGRALSLRTTVALLVLSCAPPCALLCDRRQRQRSAVVTPEGNGGCAAGLVLITLHACVRAHSNLQTRCLFCFVRERSLLAGVVSRLCGVFVRGWVGAGTKQGWSVVKLSLCGLLLLFCLPKHVPVPAAASTALWLNCLFGWAGVGRQGGVPS